MKRTLLPITVLAFSVNAIPGGFAETEVIGSIFAIPAGETRGPIKGDMGVYVVSMTSLTPSAELTDVETERKTLEQRMQGRAEGTLCLLYTSRCV